MASAIEEPKYSVVREYDGFEVRAYEPYLDAEVVVPGPAEAAGNQALPEPLDPQVKLKEIPGGRFAVIRYSGTWSERNYTEHREKLERGVEDAGLRTTGSPIYSRYNAPFVPWFMRRNEIWLKLA